MNLLQFVSDIFNDLVIINKFLQMIKYNEINDFESFLVFFISFIDVSDNFLFDDIEKHELFLDWKILDCFKSRNIFRDDFSNFFLEKKHFALKESYMIHMIA